MPSLSLTSYVTTADAADYSHITDLTLQDIGGQTLLIATTRYDGVISSWNVSGNVMVRLDTADHGGVLSAGVTGSIQSLSVDGNTTLLTGGHAGGSLGLYTLLNDGSIGAGSSLAGTTGVIGGLQHGITIQLGTGNQAVYGGVLQRAGVGQALFDANGALISTRVFPDLTTTFANQITDLATAQISGQTYLFSASAVENGVTAWAVATNGVLTQADSMGVDDGLWIANPTALATAQVLDKSYLLVGSAGSNSISVMEVDASGALIIRDHMLDTRDTRFAGITALKVVAHDGQTYVIAGGADDGISVFQLVPGGQLVHRATLTDTHNIGLANISDIAAQSTANGINIFVSSSSETGLTALRFDGGPQGYVMQATGAGGVLSGNNGADVLRGMGGDDTLRGGAGDDIIVDGTGDDVLTGGSGADVFVLSFDGTHDTITDFTLGEDRLDLSGWPMLRSANQLTMSMTSSGMQIIYGDEVLTIHSADGQTIDHRTLTQEDLIGGARVPQVILPGYLGPYTPDPDLPGRFVAPSGSQDDPFGYQGETIQGQFFYSPRYGAASGENYFGGSGSDTNHTGQGNDRLYGGSGKDTLYGDKGVDRLFGGTWHDRLSGGYGDDILKGNLGNDKIFGGDGRDRAYGGDGNDIIHGNISDDILYGQQDNDTLYGGQSSDRIYGGYDDDQMFGDTEHDMLDGGNGNDMGAGGQGRDILYGRGGTDTLYGGDGTDKIYGHDGSDQLYGGDDFDIVKGGGNHDSIWGGEGNDSLCGEDGNDRIDGGKGNDGIWGSTGDDTLLGGTGNDVIKAGKGQDIVYGGNDNDVIYGEDGNDNLYGRDGQDTLFGGDGNDEIFGESQNDRIEAGKGDDRAMGGLGDDIIYGGNGNDLTNGEDGNDIVSGGNGDDRVYGKDGHDTLNGGGDNDTLYGGEGNDTLSGDKGDDTLWGNSGNDTFHFWSGADRVADFDQAYDDITLDYDLWEGTLSVGDVLTLYGSFDGSTVTLNFDNGDVLTIAGVTDYDGFADNISII